MTRRCGEVFSERSAAILLWLTLSATASADADLMDVRVYEKAGVTTVKVVFSNPVGMPMRDSLPAQAVKMLDVHLRSESQQQGFSSTSLEFDEPHIVAGVTVEAAAPGRTRLMMRLDKAALVDVQSRDHANVVAFVLTHPGATRRSARVPPEPEVDDEGFQHVRLSVNAVTPSNIGRVPDPPAPVRRAKTPAAQSDVQNPGARASRAHSQAGADELLGNAEHAFDSADYERAVALYSKLLQNATGAARRVALERLGLARERNGQAAHAMKRYREYVAENAGTPDAARVQQRMHTLAALAIGQPPALKEAKGRARAGWRTTRSVSQFYRRHSLRVDDDSSVPIDGMFTDLSLLSRATGGAVDHVSRVSLTHLYDLTGDLEDRDLQISNAYWDSYVNAWSTGIRVGRQTKFDAGVIGRFDGAALTQRLNDRLGIGIIGGYLLDSSFDSPGTSRPFYGLYASFTSDSGAFTLNPFVVQQSFEGVTDRQAVGFQSRWISDTTSVMALADYDFHHGALNNVSVMANIGIGSPSSFNLSFDQRRSPYLTTRNALIGQPFDDLSDLERELIDLSLEDLADDRTTTSRTMRAGWNWQLDDRWSMTSDVLLSDLSGTDTSMNVAGFDSRQDVYYSMQVRADDVLGEGSYASVSLRMADSETARTSSVYWNSRFDLGERWWLYPRLRFDYRELDASGQTQYTLVPSLRLDFRLNRWVRFEFEAGYERSTRDTATRDIDLSGVFFRGGYRAVF